MRHKLSSFATAFAGGLVLMLWPHTVGAQFAGQATISVPFSYTFTNGGANYYVKNCAAGQTSTAAVPCIANINQIADTVSYTYSSGCSSLSSNPVVELDASNDGVTWYVLANGPALSTITTTSSTLNSNGYYLYRRVVIAACSTSSSVTVKGIYTAYGIPLPLNPNPSQSTATQIAGGTAQQIFASPGYFLLTGFQCQNVNAAVAYLHFYTNAVGLQSFNLGIPAGVDYNYVGPPILLYGQLLADNTTAWNGGGSSSSSPINCTVEINGNGPFYPNNPISTF